MRSSTLSRVLGVLVVAVVLGVLIGWWASRNPSADSNTEPPAQVADPESVPTPPPLEDEVMIEEPEVASTNAPFDPALWEDVLDEVLGGSNEDTDKKAEQLLDLMDKVKSVEAHEEIAGHVINLLADEHYARAAKYLTNAEVPEAISSIFMNDLYNRDEGLKLPLLLAVARNEKHALRDEAKDLLELYVEEDYGTDWAKWEEATKKYLKEHGGEPTPEAAPAAP